MQNCGRKLCSIKVFSLFIPNIKLVNQMKLTANLVIILFTHVSLLKILHLSEAKTATKYLNCV